MQHTPTIFGSINRDYSAACGAWVKFIPPQTECILATYSQGEELSDAEKGLHGITLGHPLGLVLKGRAEIFEMYVTSGFAAYRPIRIMREGELFGEFGLIDALHDVHNASSQGEMWKISSGYKSALITQALDKNYSWKLRDHHDGEMVTEHIYAHKLLDDIIDMDTTVAFVDIGFMKRKGQFYNELLDYSWPRAKIYRDCINSFNYIKKLDFERNSIKIATTLAESVDKDKNAKKYGNKISKTTLLPLFIEALFDACNRPLRREPMFAKELRLPIKRKGVNLREYGLALSDILSATDSYEDREFWFPLDIANYMIASFTAKAMLTGHDVKHERTKDMNFVLDLEKTLGGKRERSAEKMNSRIFYKDLANRLLKDLIMKSPDYPFSVVCEDIAGLERRHLALHFTKNK